MIYDRMIILPPELDAPTAYMLQWLNLALNYSIHYVDLFFNLSASTET